MNSQRYHSGCRLRALRELKGLKEKELANLLNREFYTILLWEDEGFPDDEINLILDFFEVRKEFFLAEISSEDMLEKLAVSEISRPNLDKILYERIASFHDNYMDELDLSGLGLISIPKEIFKLQHLKKLNLNDNLLTKIETELHELIKGGCEVSIKNNHISLSEPTTYNFNIKNKFPRVRKKKFLNEKIRLVELKLEHIGIYESLIINFNEDLTILIGVNGAGKTTILKALSLAILGARESIESNAIWLRSIDMLNDVDSKITLKATIDDEEYSNQIIISYDPDTSEIKIKGQPFNELFNSSTTLKNLILCLGEQRNYTSSRAKQNLEIQPRILDLLPLLRGDDQSCLQNFTSWLANLENSKTSNEDAQKKIDVCFDLFSTFMGENIQSAGLRKVEPDSELWIKYDSGKEIPLALASQGYQSVMGWLGFIIQRMIEANAMHPLPLSQHSIIIIDEIDQLLSIKWQQNILEILRRFFPNTQWIISTHSPMILTDIEKNQIIQLHDKNGIIIAESNNVDLWMWKYNDIIRHFFEISTTQPKYQEQHILDEIDIINKKSPENRKKLAMLHERLNKVKASSAAVDEFEKQLQSLKKTEQQLINIMKALKKGD